ncbi:MAG: AAA family ATPase [Bacilli bacterium]|nr:AAA family ATPase [Bacilli bacterium]
MNETLKLNNIPSLSINEIVDSLSGVYSTLINGKKPLSSFPSVFLWSAPGQGKSQSVRQIADKLGQTTKKKVVVTDVRLLLFNPIDLRGIPVANDDKTLAVWLKPKIFQMDSSEDVINILFLDELSAAPSSVQAAAYQITLDRTVGEHKLPDNCIVMAAGNRVTDKSVAIKMPKALANRMMHFEVASDFDSWKTWAIRNDVNPKVVGYLSFSHKPLNKFETNTDAVAFATPRSWEMVSNVLNNVSDDVDKVFNLVAGLIGNGAATEFRSWCSVYSSLPDIPSIFKGKETSMPPKDISTLYALCSGMTDYFRRNKKKKDEVANSIRYALNMPKDFSTMLMFEYFTVEPDIKTFLTIPEFTRWLALTGQKINGLK